MLPSVNQITTKLIFRILRDAGKQLQYNGGGTWDVVGVANLPGSDYEDLAVWLTAKGITHTAIGVVDLDLLLNPPPQN